MLGATLRESFRAWSNHVHMRRSKRDMMQRALYLWMNTRLRAAFDVIWWAAAIG
jgi:hypothetical protein